MHTAPLDLRCHVLVRDPYGRPLLTTPPRLTGLLLPGGGPDPGEPPHEAAARHLYRLTGLPIRPCTLLAVDWAPGDRHRADRADRLDLVFDGGTVTAPAAPPGTRFVHPSDLPDAMSPARAARAAEALAGNRLPLLLHGQRAT